MSSSRRGRATTHQAGVRSIELSFVNYLDEVPYFCDELLPRLERPGVQVKRHP
jgi:FMNH2-dependent dimethyl sulfone monooxygenase